MKVESVSKTLKKIVGIVLGVIILGVTAFAFMWFSKLTPVDAESEENVMFEVQKGWYLNKTIEELEKAGLIKDDLFVKLYCKFNDINSITAGNYKLAKSMSAAEIMENLQTGKNIENEVVTVTFVEGKKFPYYVTKMSEAFGFNEEDVYSLTTDETYLNELIEKYWFLTADILNKDLYYPLEGYLFADTYQFKKNSTIKDVINKMLDGMDQKLSIYKEEIQGVQWSANLGLGVEFMFGKHLGLYLDPSVRYYFSCQQPKSIRTAQPVMLGLELGLRTRF